MARFVMLSASLNGYLALALCLCTAFFIGRVSSQGSTYPPFYPQPTAGYQSTCSAIEDLSQASTLCSISDSCCTRLICSPFGESPLNPLSLGKAEFQVLPCSTPPALSVYIHQGSNVFYNNTITESQDVPITLTGTDTTLATIYIIVQHSPNNDSITFSVRVNSIVIIPETAIPIDQSQCRSQQMSDACLTLSTTTWNPSQITPTPPSSTTCQALQGIAATPSQCTVTDSCTAVQCDVFNLYPTKLTVLPCNDPPAVHVLVFQDPGGVVLLNETLTKTYTRPVVIGDIVTFDLVILVEHETNPDAIILQVVARSFHPIFTNSTIIPRTRIPIDRSKCSNYHGYTPYTPIPTTPTTTVSATCNALEHLGGLNGANCHTNPECNSVFCDLNPLVEYSYNLTVLPCLKVPGINVKFISTADQTVILDQTFTQSRLENISVGGSVVALNITVLQSSDQKSLVVEVDVVNPIGNFPIIPRTTIPIDRCDCPNIQCPVVTDGPIVSDSPSSTTEGTGSSSSTTEGTVSSLTESSKNNQASKKSLDSNLVEVLVPVLGIVIVVIVVVVGIVLCYIRKMKNKALAYSFQRVTFNEVQESDTI